METLEKTPLTDRIISGLKKAAVELEELHLQAALGKAEARDAYESAKKMFNKYIHEARIRMEGVKGLSKDRSVKLKTAFETLQLQLALGKAETKEIFESQAKKIDKALREIETFIRKNKITDVYYAELQMEIEKFRIKLDILKLQYELKKIGVKEEFEAKKKEFLNNLSDVRNNLLEKEASAGSTWEHFRDDISGAYSRLKKAFGR